MAVAKNKAQQPAAARARPTRRTRRRLNPAGRPPRLPTSARRQELAAYRDMLLIRRFEEKAGQMYGMGLIGGFCHLYIGQEAVVVGMQMALKEGDAVITGYRDHGHMLACRHGPQGRHGGTDRPRPRLFQGQGRLDAHVLGREGLLRRPRHRRGAGAAWNRARLCQQVSRQGQCLADLFRRRRGQPGPGLRELQHGEALDAAGDLHHREQSVRHGHLAQARRRRPPICPIAARPTAFRASRSTAWTCAR